MGIILGTMSNTVMRRGNRESSKRNELAGLMQDCRGIKEELERMINNLVEEQIAPPEEGSLLIMNLEDDEEFKKIFEKEVEQKKDQTVWKAYSKRGGISDTLADIKRAVDHPAANAFEFDEEEGMYIIFITINNTCISRLTDLCREMCDEYEQIEKRQMEDSGLWKKKKALIEERKELPRDREDLLRDREDLLGDREELWNKYVLPKSSTPVLDDRCQPKNKSNVEQWNKFEEKLQKTKEDLSKYEAKRKDYKAAIDAYDAYQEKLHFFKKEYEQLESYKPKYDTLYKELTELGQICSKNHDFYRLTVSPEGKEELEKYMDKAKEFCKWISDMMKLYPL